MTFPKQAKNGKMKDKDRPAEFIGKVNKTDS
jgi:hypothetical protein